MAKGQVYTAAFREEAVRVTVTSGKSVDQVAKDLGISKHTLNDWRRKARQERTLPVS